MHRKLLGIISVDFDITGQLLIVYYTFVKYLRKKWSKMMQCIRCLWTSRKKTIMLPVLSYGHETWSRTLREEHRLRVLENRVLRKIGGPEREKVTGNRENYIIRNLMICTPHQVLFGWSNREEWEGRACNTYGREERCLQDSGGEIWGKETTWKTQA